MKIKGALFLVVIIALFSFNKETFLQLKYPNYFPEPIYDFNQSPLTKEKIGLGRNLFYDPIMSIDSTVSCASCHSPYNAFSHTDHPLSHGVFDQIGDRNAPGLFNLAWQPIFMWDGAVNHLDVQALAPISHPKEMGESINAVIQKLQIKRSYRKWFYNAFGDSIITGEYLLKSLSQFQVSLISSNSKYDKMRSGQVLYTEQEDRGYVLFNNYCNSCHTEPLFTNYNFANNGIGLDTVLMDLGRQKITRNDADYAFFKIPSLRNLSYTYPYMHDGRFDKLLDVLNHYSAIHTNVNTSSIDLPIVLSSNEKIDIIAFLLTLNDKEFILDPTNKFPRESLLQGEY